MAKRIPAEDHGPNPEDAAKNIEDQISQVGHSCGASNGRTERSNDRNEARKNHCPAAVFLIEIMGTLEMAAAKKEGIFAAVKCSAGRPADPVADLVACNRTNHDWEQKPLEGNDASVREDSGGDQKGIARKKKTYKEAGFYKDDGADQGSAAGAD